MSFADVVTIVGPQYVTWFVSLLWRQELGCGAQIFGKFAHWYNLTIWGKISIYYPTMSVFCQILGCLIGFSEDLISLATLRRNNWYIVTNV